MVAPNTTAPSKPIDEAELGRVLAELNDRHVAGEQFHPKSRSSSWRGVTEVNLRAFCGEPDWCPPRKTYGKMLPLYLTSGDPALRQQAIEFLRALIERRRQETRS